MAVLHLRIFGVPELVRDGQAVRFRTRKHLALLVYLALEARGRTVSRDLLLDLLWPGTDRRRARHSLSQGLTAIRNALGTGAVSRATERVLFTCEITTDLDLIVDAPGGELHELEHPLRDMELWAGTAFAHWVDAARSRFRKMTRAALLDGLRAARCSGNVGMVHERAAQLYSMDPLCDDAVLALAEQASLGGDRIGSIRLLRDHLARTAGEVSCDPSPAVVRRLRRLERGVTVRAVWVSHGSEPGPEADVFVGRDGEIAELEALWSRAGDGGLCTCLITGPAGIGKSSLVRRFASTVAARGWPVFSTSCQEIGRAIPFAAVSDLIHALSRDAGISSTDPVWLAEASRVTPGLKILYPGIPEPPAAPPDSVRVRVAESIARVLAAVADGGPVLLVFDDIQHMDPATRDILHVLLRRLESTPTLLLATRRTSEFQRFSPLPDQTIGDLSWHQSIELTALGTEQALTLIAAHDSPPDRAVTAVRGKIIELAQGNPYLIEMLLSDWRRDPARSLVSAELAGDRTGATWRPPETMRRAFARQYLGLSAMTQQMLGLLAAAGRRMETREIAPLLAVSFPEVDRAALEAIERGILRVERAAFDFKNEIHRAFVYFALAEEPRRYHHTRLAQALSRSPDQHDFQRLLEASHHLLRAGMAGEAVEAVTRGAELAVAKGAPKEAERAVNEVIRSHPLQTIPRMHLVLAKALVAQGQYRRVLEALSQVTTQPLTSEDQATEDTLRAEALYRGRLADDGTIAAAAKRAIRSATAAEAETSLLSALQVSAEVASDRMDLETLEDVALAARRIGFDTLDQDVRALAQITLGYCLMVTGEFGRARDILNQAATTLRERSRDTDLRWALNGLGICHTNTGDFTQAAARFDEAIVCARRVGDSFSESVSWDNLAVLYDDLGRFAEAAHAYRKALDLCRIAPVPRRSAMLFANAASLATTLGDYAQAQELLDQAEEQACVQEGESLLLGVLMGRADLYLAQREHELAWRAVNEVLALTRGRTPLNGSIGQFERQRRHFVWATQGYEAMRRLPAMARAGGLGNGIARRLEVQAFQEWVSQVEGDTGKPASALDDLIRRGLVGVVARLISLGVCPGHLPTPGPGESAALLVSRLYPDPARGVVPERVFEPSRGGALPTQRPVPEGRLAPREG